MKAEAAKAGPALLSPGNLRGNGEGRREKREGTREKREGTCLGYSHGKHMERMELGKSRLNN